MDTRIGTAGWSVSRELDDFPAEGTGLERYAAVFDCVEINSSFYRPHQRKTYERWAASTPDRFRFAVKVPQTITHERRLIAADDLIERFLGETAGLGGKLGPLLIQTPPSLRFEPDRIEAFFSAWRARTNAATVLEPRHASWFQPSADTMLKAFSIARVAADPAIIPAALKPGGANSLTYRRWHGSPVMYESAYSPAALAELASRLTQNASTAEAWCVFDNTRSGAATRDALDMLVRLGRREK